MRLTVLQCKLCALFIFMLLGIFGLTGHAFAQDQAAFPSTVLGEVNGCQHEVLRIKFVPGCDKVDLDQTENELVTDATTDLNKVLQSSEFKALQVLEKLQ